MAAKYGYFRDVEAETESSTPLIICKEI